MADPLTGRLNFGPIGDYERLLRQAADLTGQSLSNLCCRAFEHAHELLERANTVELSDGLPQVPRRLNQPAEEVPRLVRLFKATQRHPGP